MDTAKLMKLAIAAGLLYGAYKFAPGGAIKNAMVLGVAGVTIARNLPYVNNYLG